MTTRSDPDTGVPLDVAARTSMRTIVLSGVGAATAVGYFVIQAVIESAATQVTGTDVSVGSPDPSFPVIGLLFGFLLLRSMYDVVSWFARRYTVGDHELIIDEGIVTRHHRVAPFARVQQVDVRRPFVAQALDIAEVRIDTAGEAGTTTMRLRMLRRSDAEQLREYILARRSALQRPATADGGGRAALSSPPGTTAPAPSQALVRLTPEQLLLAAITHSTVVVGLPVVVAASIWLISFRALVSGSAAFGGGLALTFVAGVLLVAHVVRSVTGHWGYALDVTGDDVHVRFGLFDVRQLTIPRRRVQQITIVDNPARRALGIVALTMHSAAGLGGGDREGATRFEVPLLDRSDVDAFLALMMGSAEWQPPTFERRPPRAKRRAVVRRVALLAALAVVPAVAFFPLGLLALGASALGVPWGLTAHGRAGHGRSSALIAFSRGALHHLVELVPVSRIQSCRTDTNPMQRINGLSTLHVDIAGDRSSPRLYDMQGSAAAALMVALPRVSSSATARRDAHQ